MRTAPTLLEMEDEIVAQISNALRMRVAEHRGGAGDGLAAQSQALAFLCAARVGNYAAEAVDPAKRAEILEACDEALRLDPHNALALGVRAVGLLNGVDQGQSADREGDLRRAKEDITTLLAVNANNSYAHALNVYLLKKPRSELLPVRSVVGPFARRGDPLACRNRSRLPDDGHEIAMPARLCSKKRRTRFPHFARTARAFPMRFRDFFDAAQNDGDPSLRCNYLHLAGRSGALAGNCREFGRKARTVFVHSPLHKRSGGIN